MLDFFRLLTEGTTAEDWALGAVVTLALLAAYGIVGAIETGAIW